MLVQYLGDTASYLTWPEYSDDINLSSTFDIIYILNTICRHLYADILREWIHVYAERTIIVASTHLYSSFVTH